MTLCESACLFTQIHRRQRFFERRAPRRRSPTRSIHTAAKRDSQIWTSDLRICKVYCMHRHVPWGRLPTLTRSDFAALLHAGLSGSRVRSSTPAPAILAYSLALLYIVWLSVPVRDKQLTPLMAGTPELCGEQGWAARLPSPRRAPTTVAPLCSAAPFLPSVTS